VFFCFPRYAGGGLQDTKFGELGEMALKQNRIFRAISSSGFRQKEQNRSPGGLIQIYNLFPISSYRQYVLFL